MFKLVEIAKLYINRENLKIGLKLPNSTSWHVIFAKLKPLGNINRPFVIQCHIFYYNQYCKLRITNCTLQISFRELAKEIYKLNIANGKFRIAKCPLEYEFAKKMTPSKFQPKSLIQTTTLKSQCSSIVAKVISNTFKKKFPKSIYNSNKVNFDGR